VIEGVKLYLSVSGYTHILMGKGYVYGFCSIKDKLVREQV
jgi:hypothetical protein